MFELRRCSSVAAGLTAVLFVCVVPSGELLGGPQLSAQEPGRPDALGPAMDCSVYGSQDDSPYALPYPAGEAYPVWASTRHFVPGNGGVGLYAIDFRMPIGTRVLAARAGSVVAVRDHFSDGNGVDLEENFVFIQHDDGTVARYFHLTRGGARVAVDDEVSRGQLIGISGNTGQSAGPHLHFDVQQCGPNLPPNYNRLPCGQTVPVTFVNTEPHACGVVVGRSYRAR